MDKEYTTTNVQHAMQYTCMLFIRCPVGSTLEGEGDQSGKELRVELATRESERSYYHIPDGYYAYIVGCSHCGCYLIPTNTGVVRVSAGNSLTKTETEALVALASRATTMHDEPKDDPVFQCNVHDYNMSAVVSELVSSGKARVRYTDHEFRDDERNLKWIEGYSLDREIPVEGLLPSSELGQHLIKLCNVSA